MRGGKKNHGAEISNIGKYMLAIWVSGISGSYEKKRALDLVLSPNSFSIVFNKRRLLTNFQGLMCRFLAVVLRRSEVSRTFKDRWDEL